MAAQYDLEIYQGSDFTIQFQLNDALGAPFDLSGATVASQIRSYSGVLLATFTVNNQALGLTTLSLTRAVTADLPAERHKYNVILRANNLDQPIIEGAVIVRPRITVTV